MNITDPIRRHAQDRPDAEAIIRPNGKAVSYRELDRTMDLIAAGVQRLGLAPGTVATIETGSSYRRLVSALALARLGIGIADLTMPAEGYDIRFVDGATPTRTSAKSVWFEPLWPRNSPLPADVPQVPSHQDGTAICAIFPTSATTGKRRHVAISHALMKRRLASHGSTPGIAARVRQICTIGSGTSYGFRTRLHVLCNGGVVVMMDKIEQLVPCVERHRVNSLVVAPFALQRVLPGLPRDFGPLPMLEQIEVGGSALPGSHYDLARQRLCANITSRYGATETGFVAAAPMLALQGHPGAVGFVDPQVEVQAVDADDNPLPPGSAGTLRVRSDGCATAYLRDPAASARVFRNGWVYPGDEGAVSPDGLLTIMGRSNDVINQGGIKFSPETVEDVLLSSPEVREAAAFGVPDALGVMRIWAAIVPNGTPDMKALVSLCRERLKRNAPTSFLRLRKLPRNEAGKVLRDELRSMAIAARAKRGNPSLAPRIGDVS